MCGLRFEIERRVGHLYQAPAQQRAAVAARLREQAADAVLATTYLSVAARSDPAT